MVNSELLSHLKIKSKPEKNYVWAGSHAKVIIFPERRDFKDKFLFYNIQYWLLACQANALLHSLPLPCATHESHFQTDYDTNTKSVS